MIRTGVLWDYVQQGTQRRHVPSTGSGRRCEPVGDDLDSSTVWCHAGALVGAEIDGAALKPLATHPAAVCDPASLALIEVGLAAL